MAPERERENTLDSEVIREMNRELRSFLEHSLASEAFWEKWTAIDFPAERLRCWEIKNCDRVDCPSFRDIDCRCWLKAGTLCGGEIQGDFAKKYRSCFRCEVMERVENDALRSLYEHINILIHHLRKRDEKIIADSITDQLTGVYNRLYFNEYMEKRLVQADRQNECLSLFMIDLDGFKGLNDTHGHRAGDEVLVETASLLRQVVRDSDMIFRYGGDEFLILFPDLGCDKAGLLKERIGEAVADWNREQNRFAGFALSLSVGCATWEKGDDLPTRVGEADAQMYHAKRARKQLRREANG